MESLQCCKFVKETESWDSINAELQVQQNKHKRNKYAKVGVVLAVAQ